ncbi:CDP-diacylglycerol--serine O-phosphatidyltransferase [Rubritalea sp.]|uniref:CDP-diacylglycerol--serine O-phosphatidyltransferase n=1 Tax=Rubritalea sp. TaxID=2109375 RepID=UPI003EF751F1
MSHEEQNNPYEEPKIYLLPNLMTAGNLCCGFFAVLTIFKGMQHDEFKEAYTFYQQAIMLIFGSCIFDLLDGRLARLGGQESPFGQEFDSIADVVSFGMAPALLVSKAVLFPLSEQLGNFKLGWAIAFIYLLCGAMRLARFNCLANLPKKPGDNLDFRGIPIPMAAGFIASITFLIIHLYRGDAQNNLNLGAWNYVLAAVMLGLSALMLSNVRYPSFKKVDWRTKGSLWGVVLGAIFIMLIMYEQTRWYTPTLLFTLYLVYGLLRPFLSKRLQKKLEEKVES